MHHKTYHIDPDRGDDLNDGLSPDRPVKSHAALKLGAGDTVLYKRGCIVRGTLRTTCGNPQAPITFGAYGRGRKPAFYGSVPVGDPGQWVQERPSLWRFTGTLSSEVCNLVFNFGQSCGNLRWRIEDLKSPGEWHYTAMGNTEGGKGSDAGVLYLDSPINPGLAWFDIECVLYGQRKMVGGDRHLIFENLCFQNAGVHAYQGIGATGITFHDCEFRFIGGAVWNRECRIRFGNAIEFWDGATDIAVERCVFDNIYDSGVTHQGGETRHIPERLHFRNNLFIGCGMAAYECREPSQEVYFEHNTCVHAGGGFSMQGDTPPRQSEIHPQPMGHHIFIWRIDPGTQPGRVYLRHNIFYESPYGAAVYSIIAPEDERKIIIDHNAYWQTTGSLLNHLGGVSYLPSEFERYRKETGQDAHSCLVRPHFVDEPHADFRQADGSPCRGMGIQ